MIVIAAELCGGKVSWPGAGPVERTEKAEGVKEKGGPDEVLLRSVLP